VRRRIGEPRTARPVLEAEQRRRFSVRGLVQGVGFRPFVHRLAIELGLRGFVGNDSLAVFIEVQGSASALAEFARRCSNCGRTSNGAGSASSARAC
jgi:acylphosphatase